MPADIFVKRRNDSLLFFAAVSALTIGSIIVTKYDVVAGFASIGKAFVWGMSNFYPNAHALTKLPDIAHKLWDTILMSIAATTSAAVFAMMLAMVGSRTTRINKFFSVIARGLASIILQAVLPSSLPQMVSWLLFMIDTNIRDATLVGLLTGTGVGFSFDVYYKSFHFHEASLVVIMIVITIITIEMISNYIRRIIL